MLRITIIFVLLYMIVPIMAQDYMPEFEPAECPYFMEVLADDNGVTISCGYLLVPENRDDVDGSLELELFVVRIESRIENDNVPIIYLEGGPGGAASSIFEDWVTFAIIDTHDVVFIDQRGTGFSYPSLNCPEFDDSFDDVQWIRDCRDRLINDDGVDLTMYTSATNAHDVFDLLIALDIPQANLYGSSYGARLALTVMRDFPERIRSVIIDAVYPPQADSLVDQATLGYQAIDQLLNDCHMNSECDRTYPYLREKLDSAIANMNASPAEIPDYEMGYVVEMNGDNFVNDLFNRLYDAEGIPYLPALIEAYYRGDYGYDPQIDAEQRILNEQIQTDTIQPDAIDELAMTYLGFDDLLELYTYYFSLDDDEFDNLLDELDDIQYYTPFMDYLGLDSLDAVEDYLDEINYEEELELDAWVHGIFDDDSEGMYYSVECAEEILFYMADDVIAFSEPLPDNFEIALLEPVLFGFDECDIWDVTVSDALETQPVVSDIPTLIFSGAYDPITPAQYGEDTAQYLSNSWHFVFPAAGHGAFDTQDCAFEVGLQFLMNPVQDPSLDCLDTLSPPDFFIR